MELSCIVKAIPTVSSNEKQEEQTHEVLRVSLDLFCEQGLLTVNLSKSHSAHMFFFSFAGFRFSPNWKRHC